MEKADIKQSLGHRPPVTSLPYHRHLRTLHARYPHLESVSLYSQECEKLRVTGQLGSHDSNSILAAEITNSDMAVHRINCYDSNEVDRYHEMLTGTGDTSVVRSRILVIEDLSPAAIELLGTRFNLDPHVFYFHLGFDTRRSAMVDLIDPKRENSIPVTWCMPGHVPENFISVPLPCDLKPFDARRAQGGLPMTLTYSRQAYRAITTLLEPQDNWDPPQRAFHRLSLICPQAKVETTILLAFPTWKSVSPVLSGISQSPYKEVLDSFGLSLETTATETRLCPSHEANPSSEEEFERVGVWAAGQWARTRPLFQALISQSPNASPSSVRKRALLWLYSKAYNNYFLACQNEGRCWRDLRAVLDQGCFHDRTSQQPKRKFRDIMTKTIELLKISTDWLNTELESANDQETYQKLRRKVGIIMSYEEARLGQVLLNINDEQSEMQMKLMVQKLREGRYAIGQAISVGQLTKLAFIFVPLTTVCSAFSMNLKKMDVPPPVWLFVVISILCTAAAVIVSSEKIREMYQTMTLRLRRKASSRRDEKADLVDI
ncbi:hypothetical protein PHISP_06203 [Aspergillus sp. HF37]|nr:hypothetical protein PHISP_06203 [Aspergillus sp. HF37]